MKLQHATELSSCGNHTSCEHVKYIALLRNYQWCLEAFYQPDTRNQGATWGAATQVAETSRDFSSDLGVPEEVPNGEHPTS